MDKFPLWLRQTSVVLSIKVGENMYYWHLKKIYLGYKYSILTISVTTISGKKSWLGKGCNQMRLQNSSTLQLPASLRHPQVCSYQHIFYKANKLHSISTNALYKTKVNKVTLDLSASPKQWNYDWWGKSNKKWQSSWTKPNATLN